MGLPDNGEVTFTGMALCVDDACANEAAGVRELPLPPVAPPEHIGASLLLFEVASPERLHDGDDDDDAPPAPPPERPCDAGAAEAAFAGTDLPAGALCADVPGLLELPPPPVAPPESIAASPAFFEEEDDEAPTAPPEQAPVS